MPLVRWIGLLMLLPLLTACGLTDFLDSGDDEAPLPGRRISILALDRGLSPDPGISDMQVRLPEPYANDRWTQPAGGPTHAMYHLALGTSPSVAWRADVGEGSGDDGYVLASPVVVNDRIFTMDSRSLVSAFDAGGGRRLWETDVAQESEEDGYFGGGIAFADGRVFATTGFGRVFALDADSGEILWEQRAAAPIHSAPTVSDGRLYVVTVDNQMLVLSTETGERLWDHVGVQVDAGLVGSASPAVAKDFVVVPYSSGELVGLLVDQGRQLWSETLSSYSRIDPLSDIASISAQPVIDRGEVIALSHAGRMIALELQQGVRRWDLDVGGVETPWVAGQFVYVLTNDSQVVCLLREDGRVRWVQSLPRFEDEEDQEDPIRWVGPVLAGDRLIVAGSNGQAVSLSPYTGEALGAIDLPGAPAVTPVVADNTLYFLTHDAELIAMR